MLQIRAAINRFYSHQLQNLTLLTYRNWILETAYCKGLKVLFKLLEEEADEVQVDLIYQREVQGSDLSKLLMKGKSS